MPWYQPTFKADEQRAARNAKVLRRSLTGPEQRLWWALRHRLSIEGTHFRRQVRLGPYIVDFCCLAQRLVVEVDGGQHTLDDAVIYDALRTSHPEEQGFRVLRFTNREVMVEIDSVLDTILASLSQHPPPLTPPHEGEGKRSP